MAARQRSTPETSKPKAQPAPGKAATKPHDSKPQQKKVVQPAADYLDDLLPVTPGVTDDTDASWIDRRLIDPGPFQYRRYFDPKELQATGESIRSIGQQQPCIVRPYPAKDVQLRPELAGRYQLVAGEGRYRSTGPEYGPEVERLLCRVKRGLSDFEATQIATDENERRRDPAPIARARAMRNLYEVSQEAAKSGGVKALTWTDVGAQFGFKNERSARRMVQLLELPEPVQLRMEELNLSEKHGRALLLLQGTPTQQTLLKQMARESMSGDAAIERAEILSGKRSPGTGSGEAESNDTSTGHSEPFNSGGSGANGSNSGGSNSGGSNSGGSNSGGTSRSVSSGVDTEETAGRGDYLLSEAAQVRARVARVATQLEAGTVAAALRRDLIEEFDLIESNLKRAREALTREALQ
jgi:ParB/RepB/Spo0J family partition protein